MRFITLPFLLSFMISSVFGQESELPYREIPDYPASYTAANVAARMIDGLGFRYYWATDGLRDEDLKFKPNGDARATEETIFHIYDLSIVIVNATNKVPNVSGVENKPATFSEMRRLTIENFKKASNKLKESTDQEMNEFTVIFKNGERTTEYPYWNLLNGPIADALWHTGQIVSFRRSSGNPFNSNVSVFTGKVRE